MANANIAEITDGSFQAEVLESDKPVLVDFWAEWCMPCRVLGQTIDEIAGEYAGRVKIAKVDIDSNREVPVKYGIQAIPTVILFKGGELKKRFVGLVGKGDLAAALDDLLKA
ncbi:MAG: thioredoxin [Phycisphaeraceae bacterium]|nr:thioredoxin [Phycisphaeraceae bacterium]